MFASPGKNPVAGALNTVTNAASGAMAAATNAVNSTVKAVNQVATQAANAVGNAAAAVPPAINSLIPFGAPANANKKNNAGGFAGNLFGNAGAGAGAPNANRRNSNAGALGFMSNLTPPNVSSNAGAANSSAVNSVMRTANAAMSNPLGIFIALVAVFLVIFVAFREQIVKGYEYVLANLKQAMGLESKPDVASQVTPSQGTIQELTTPPQPAQLTPPPPESIAEKILPSLGSKEVFNVAQNTFNYYDAEPLCKALGAELATYEQVKDAWSKGADWCNYGWVKGQMAVYPTQKDTYDKLQYGPPDEKNACGTVGVNGGVFDNPELRFGVNCFGKKPDQSAHDQRMLMDQGKAPKTAETLKVDRMMAEFKAKADELFVKPFNDGKWSGAMP